MRTLSSICLAALAFGVGCGPSGPGSLEGFGSRGETSDTTPGDGGPGDGEPGDGDGEPAACNADYDLGSQLPAYIEGYLDPQSESRIATSCFGEPDSPESIIAWTAPVPGEYYAYAEAEFAPELLFARGECDPDAGFECVPPFDPVIFYADAGQTFTFVMQDVDSFGGSWFLGIEQLSGPTSCPDGFIEPTLPAQWAGETNQASDEFRSDCGGDGAPDRSFLFYPEISGIYRFNTFGSGFDTVIHVFEGECNGDLLACNDDAQDVLDSQVEVELFAGQGYTFVVDGFGDNAGAFMAELTLEAAAGCPPVFDVLPAQAPVAQQWNLGDAPPSAPMYTCGPNGGQRRIIWEAPAAGNYRFSTQGSDVQTSLLVFEGLCEDELASDCSTGLAPQGTTIERFVEAGEVVDLVVTHTYDVGVAQLTIESADVPGCQSTELSGPLPIQVQGQTAGPSLHSGTCGDGGGNAPEVVYNFTAPTADIYRFTTDGSTFDTIMYMRDEVCAGQEMCNDDGGPGLTSRIDRMLAQGQTVTIFVDGYDESQGNYTLTVSRL